MDLSCSPPFDHVEVISDISPFLKCTFRGSWLFASLPCHHLRLSVWVTEPTMVPSGPRGFLGCFRDDPHPCFQHPGSHPPHPRCPEQLPQAHRPAHTPNELLSLLLPHHDALWGGWLLVSPLLKPPLWSGAQVPPGLGPSLNCCGFHSSTLPIRFSLGGTQ